MVPPTSNSISDVASSSVSVSLFFFLLLGSFLILGENFFNRSFALEFDCSLRGIFRALWLMEGLGHFALFTAMGGGKRE